MNAGAPPPQTPRRLRADRARLIQAGRSAPGPALLFDAAALAGRMRHVSEIGARYGCHFSFPVKAFPHSRALTLADELLAGFDAELRLLPPATAERSVTLTDPTFSSVDVAALCAASSSPRVFVDTSEQLDLALTLPSRVLVGLRLAVGMALRAGGREPGPVSRFGADHRCLERARELRGRLCARFAGFHAHQGVRSMDGDEYLAMARGMLRLASDWGLDPPRLNLGGGLSRVGLEGLEALLRDLRAVVRERIALDFEPGQLLTEQTGIALGRVVSVRRNPDSWVVVTDLSRHLHVRWCQPRLIRTRTGGTHTTKVWLHGPTCHEGDTFGDFDLTTAGPDHSPFAVGDWIALEANGYCVGLNHGFNGIPPARVQFV